MLRARGLRVEVDDSSNRMQNKIRLAQEQKVPVHAGPRRSRDRGPSATVRRRGRGEGSSRRPSAGTSLLTGWRQKSPTAEWSRGGARRRAAAPGPRPLQHAGHEPDHRTDPGAVPVVRMAVPRRAADGAPVPDPDHVVPSWRSGCHRADLRRAHAVAQNVLVAGSCSFESPGDAPLQLASPEFVHDPSRRLVPWIIQIPLAVLRVSDFIVLQVVDG